MYGIKRNDIDKAAIDATKIDNNALEGKHATKFVAGTTDYGLSVFFFFDCSAASATITLFNANVPFNMEIVGVYVICTGANTSGTLKLTDGTNDITNAMIMAVDKTVVWAGTIDDAYSSLSKGATLKATKNAAADKGDVVIIAVKK